MFESKDITRTFWRESKQLCQIGQVFCGLQLLNSSQNSLFVLGAYGHS